MSRDRLLALLKIQPAEARMAGLVALFFGVIDFGRTLGDSVADALFFRRFGVENLPYMYIVLGIVTFTALLSYTAFIGRFDKRRFFSNVLYCMAALLLFERAAIALNVRALYPVLWLSINVVLSLLGTVIWTTASEVCDARQAKRLFPIFVSASILGSLIGSLIIGPFARLLGTESLILLYVVLLAGAAALVRVIARRYFRTPGQASEAPSFIKDIGAGFGYVKRSPLLQLLAVAAVLFSVLYFSVSFPFGRAVAAALPNEADLAAFLGLFKGVSSTLMFVAALLIANRLYARIGIVYSLLILPVTYLLGFVLFASAFTLTSAVIVRLAQSVVLSGIGDGAYGAFFNIVPPERRGQVRAFDAGVPSQIGTILSGVLLILGGRVLSTTGIFIMGMVVAMMCAFVVWRMRGAYASALVTLLRAGRIEAFSSGHRIFAGLSSDADAVRVLAAALEDPRPGTRQLAAEMLARINAAAAVPALIARLSDADDEVRVAAVTALGTMGAREAAGPVIALLGDSSAPVRAAALRALPWLGDRSSAETRSAIAAMLSDAQLDVAAQAAISLAACGERHTALNALVAFLRGASDDSARVVLLPAFEAALRAAPDPGADDAGEAVGEIVRLLQDESPLVRAAACRVLAAVVTPASAAALAERLADPSPVVTAAAAEALRSMGAVAAPFALAQLRTAPASAPVLDALPPGDATLREPLRLYFQEELARLREWRTASLALPRAGTAVAFLSYTLNSRALQTEQHLVKTIGLLGNENVMRLVALTLRTADPDARAAAIEALDTLGDKQLVRAFLPLLEVSARGEAADPGDEARTEQLVRGLVLTEDRLVQAVALRAAGELKLRSLAQDLQAFADHTDEELRAAAREALCQLGGTVETLPTLSLIERTLMLKEVPLFCDLSPDDLVQVAQLAEECWFADRVVLCREGEYGHELYIIASGQVRVTKQAGGGEHVLSILGAGEFVGEMAIIDSVPRFATVTALGDTRVLVFNAEMFKSILRDRPEVALGVMRGLSRRLREQSQPGAATVREEDDER